jgi:hypothetical protein
VRFDRISQVFSPRKIIEIHGSSMMIAFSYTRTRYQLQRLESAPLKLGWRRSRRELRPT